MPKKKKVIKPKAKTKKKPVAKKKLATKKPVRREITQVRRNGYTLYFLDPNDEQKLIELRNTGKAMGEINFDSDMPGLQKNEVVIAIRD